MHLITFSDVENPTATIHTNDLYSPRARSDDHTKETMDDSLSDSDKTSLVRYRRKLLERRKERESDSNRKLRKRLNKHHKPLPVRITEDRKREKNLQSDNISPIV